MHQDDEELEVRMMFLEEAIGYIENIEDGLVDLDPHASNFRSKIDSVLRAAHSLKGGAAMMQFEDLSHAAHLLEDSLKIVRENRPEIDFEIEGLLFNSSEILRQIVRQSRSQQFVDREWLETQVFPLFEKLETQLNNAAAAEGVEEEEEEEVNLAAIMFESEVESYLEQLEGLVTDPETSPTLDADVLEIAGDLAGMGEMLELSNFVALCQSVIQALVAKSHPTIEIAEAALSAWRNAQALVMIGNTGAIATYINLPPLEERKAEKAVEKTVGRDTPDLATTEELLAELEEVLEITEAGSLADGEETVVSERELSVEAEESQAEPGIQEMFDDLESYLNLENEPELENTTSNSNLSFADELNLEDSLALDRDRNSDDRLELESGSDLGDNLDLESILDLERELNLENNLNLDDDLSSEDSLELADKPNSEDRWEPENRLNREEDLGLDRELNAVEELNLDEELGFEDRLDLENELGLEEKLGLEPEMRSSDRLDLGTDLGLGNDVGFDLETQLADSLDLELERELESSLNFEDELNLEDRLTLESEAANNLNLDGLNPGDSLDIEAGSDAEDDLNLEPEDRLEDSLELENELEVSLGLTNELNLEDSLNPENELEGSRSIEVELNLEASPSLASKLERDLDLADGLNPEENIDLEGLEGNELDSSLNLEDESTLEASLDLESELDVILSSEESVLTPAEVLNPEEQTNNILQLDEAEADNELDSILASEVNDIALVEDLNFEEEITDTLQLEESETEIAEGDEETLDEEERAVRMMFLEEASEYIDSIDDGLADFDTSASNFKQQIDRVLRAAHSLKGGAAMMQFDALSRAAHRLEDSFKILKENRPAITSEIEGLLFNSAEILRQIAREYKQGTKVTSGWLEANAFPTFEALEAQLNAAEATEAVEEEEEEVSLVVMMFESEVESYLDRLEGLVTDSDSTLYTELTAIAEDLAGIGEMLELPNFVSLCQSVTQALADRSCPIPRIAESALAAWRNAQALVTIGNTEAIATQITLPPLAEEELSEILEEVYAELSEDAPSLETELEIADPNFLTDAVELTERLADEDELSVDSDSTELKSDVWETAKHAMEEDLRSNEVDSVMDAIADLDLDEIENAIEFLELERSDEPEADLNFDEVEAMEVLEPGRLEEPGAEIAEEEPLDEEEKAVRMMFLEEASEYIDSIDDGLADFDTAASNFKQRIDQVLRAAHSLKGGAAMMQFDVLSQAAHRLEDSFKLLKENRPAVSPDIARLLFSSSEILRQIVRQCKQGVKVTSEWLNTNAFPIFAQLETQLNAAEPIESAAEEEEEETNLAVMMFESEVGSYIDRLEALVANPDTSSTLAAELTTIAEDLAGIGEMLELPNFVSLCQSVTQALAAQSHPTQQIAEAALVGWRNAQALVIIDNTGAIATQVSLPTLVEEANITDVAPLPDITPEEFEGLLPQDITVGEFATDIDEFATELEAVAANSSMDTGIVSEVALTDTTELERDLDLDSIDVDELERSQVTDSFDDLDVFAPQPDELEDELEGDLENELIFEPERLDTPFQDKALEAFIFDSIFDVADGIDLFGSSNSAISTANKNNKRTVNAQTGTRVDNPPKPEDKLPGSRDRASTDETPSPRVDALDDTATALPDPVSTVTPKESYPQVETLDNFLSDAPDAITSADREESSPQVSALSDAPTPVTPITPKESSHQPATLDVPATPIVNDAVRVTTSKKVDEDKNLDRVTEASNARSPVKAGASSKAAKKDKQDKVGKSSSDMPALKTIKGKDFSAYVKPEADKTPDKAQKTSKSQDAAGSLFELFEDLDTSQESNDLPVSLPQSVSDMLAAYLKEASIRLPVSRLEQMYDISEELSIGNNGVDRQLRRMRSLVKILDGRMRDLENTNLQLQSAYDRMTLQNSLGLEQSDRQANDEYDEHASTSAAHAVAEPAIASETSAYTDFDNLEMDRYGEMHSLSQSVIETIVQLEEAIADVNLTLAEAEQNASNQNRHFKQLQTAIAQIRMRPISDIVSKFPRVIRSLSMQHSKDVDLVIKGGDTLIDRAILDALSDPLNHILRNAFDHGIEVASVRAERGKPAQGKILIETLFQGDKILVIIQDDGGGIDAEKIRNKVRKMAIESGKDTSQIDVIPRQKLLSLIFEPGFSTADKVTSLSGRGVGMDVVQTNLNQIGAKISIDTEVGVGTTFTISIPFTLLSTRVLLVQVGQAILAIPSSAIAGVVACSSPDIFKQDNRYGFVWQGQTIPVVQLSDRLKLNCQHQIDYIDDRIVTSGSATIVVELKNELAAILVDAFWSEQEATIRQIEGNIKLPKLFSGCIILGSGQAVPLLDLNEVALQFLTGMELLIPPAPELPAAAPAEPIDSPESTESAEPVRSPASTELTESLESLASVESAKLPESSAPTALVEPPELPKSPEPTTPLIESLISPAPALADLKPPTPQPPTANRQPPTRTSILVVDDSINVRRFLALTLEKAGFRVEQAKDGEDALSKLVEGLRVDAVVSDIEMPRLDGYGLLSQIRAKPEYGKLPVIMLTSRSGDKHRRLAMNLGATGYFTKPYQERELIETLRELTQPKSN